jgi:O-methyltransferase involved in polyketide biosynthesis
MKPSFGWILLAVLCWFSIQHAEAWTMPLPKRLMGIRGFEERKSYGLANNSTIPDPFELAAIVGVKPCSMAPSLVWKYAWRLHGAILPILHFGDKAKPRDSKYSLKVLWCKAIASMDRTSKVYDEKWTYDTLPSLSRWLLRLFPTWIFPRLHHANIEARTAYLNKIIQSEMDRIPQNTTIRLISLGAGYDIRCSRLLSQYSLERPMEAYELDLPHVVESKQKILDRLSRRRPNTRHPTLIPVDLNEVDGAVKETLQCLLSSDSNQPTHTIYISEGVLIYLKEGVPSKLLKLYHDAVVDANEKNTASFCFADRLENVPGGSIDAARVELSKAGWELIDFCPKPGLARHMGISRLAS